MMMNLTERVTTDVLNIIKNDNKNKSGQLINALRHLAKWRSLLIQNTIVERSGTIVLQGLLSGLDFLRTSAEGCHVAKLLGTYEQPLQAPLGELLGESAYQSIINIGCAEGYYAVGLARLVKDITSYAYDTNPNARKACRELAEKNNVTERMVIGELFSHADFARFSGIKCLVLCDIEGAEKELLDPILAPELAALDIVVESHECLIPGITELLINRFKDTHDIIKIEDNGMRELSGMPSWFYELAHLDQLLSVWEWRSGPTPWLIMRSKQGSV